MMQEFVAALVIFALAALGLGIGLLCGYRRLRPGCHRAGEPASTEGCGRPDCCATAQRPRPKSFATVDDDQAP